MRIKAGKPRVNIGDTSEYGIVEKLSIQGDFLYAVVRKEGIFYRDEEDKLVNYKTELFGSNGVPEQELTLAEVLIPTDLLPAMITMDINFFIGKKIEVIINNGFPRMALLSRVTSTYNPRGISSMDINEARTSSETLALESKGKTFLSESGYGSERVNSISKEKYIDISGSQSILRYGIEQSWDLDIQKDNKNKSDKDMSEISNFKFVSGLRGKPLKTKNCYIPILSIGGKV